MARISVIGGSGYAGGHIVREAVKRGHQVMAYSRRAPSSNVPGAEYVEADVLSDGTLQRTTRDADVVVCALSPRGPLAGRTRQAVADLAALVGQQGIRLGVVGGAGSLRIGEHGPLVKDTADFPAEFKAEAEEMGAVLEDLRTSDAELDWFYVSPAGGFGAWAPGTATQNYRLGGDQLLVDADGRSDLSGADLAHAVLNEIETPAHRRARFAVAY
jgi:putative NADH-flavin reductase